MIQRHSSPYSRTASPRPETFRKRSNSFPLVDVLGCSTPEAELILAEGRAAVRSRLAQQKRRGRRNRSADDDTFPMRPTDHIHYLEQRVQVEEPDTGFSEAQIPDTRHARVSSNITDKSGSTITGLAPPVRTMTSPPLCPASPLGDYSANLARFIQSQLESIASYQPSPTSPRSCSDLAVQVKLQPRSPISPTKRQSVAPNLIDIPPVRPPLRSQFSAWSSADDSEDGGDNELGYSLGPVPTLSSVPRSCTGATPSILQYYETANNASFLFSSTPLEEEHKEGEHPNAEGFTFPSKPPLAAHETDPGSTQYDSDYPSSALSSRPQLTASSAPSFTSSSTASYFDCKRPIAAIPPQVRDRIIAAVSPRDPTKKVVHATSPFEGDALANVHEILIESQHRVLVDGLSFDLVQNMDVSDVVPRVTTQC
ncbi:hypothetical protein BU24DRAFT_146579 [Aaosphaeria arxii CBS 175.79]|uniref:Uncharacterized protein n=1 Tax=Aaosphaeria arxii CBS 175.79 TaxID=1450172 RepID=A0A6A5XV96_9PLEO|nr:uncharacterized protein BU24DRAFT_146579 [Aaosphaeria arxii CBS 175.79]KAF2017238.1 hypothetical protein BU24DRAFT_146579 [Aaosphaeria arxii CBS 175.79]